MTPVTASAGLVSRCVICSGADPLGLGVCSGCGGGHDGADTFVFVRRERDPLHRHRVIEHLGTLFPKQTSPEELRHVVDGDRALVKVPRAGALRVRDALEARHVPVHTTSRWTAWTNLPTRLGLFLAAVVGVGIVAGAAVLPAMLLVSPAVGLGLFVAAQRHRLQPLIRPADRPSRLPPDVEARAVDTLRRLPDGAARTLLADLVHLGQTLYAYGADAVRGGEVDRWVRELLDQCCDAAQHLAGLDAYVSRVGVGDAADDAAIREVVARCETTRARLVDRLTRVIALVGQAANAVARSGAHGDRDLERLAQEIDRHFAAHDAAAREIADLLNA